MKKMTAFSSRLLLLPCLLVMNLITFAQDKGIDVNIDINKKNEWYRQPWVWVVGAAVFILLLVAILRGKKS